MDVFDAFSNSIDLILAVPIFVLVIVAVELTLNFKSAHPHYQSFVSMPGFYNSVDVIICSSSDEGAGGPVLEGGAAGKLIITTKTGGFEQLVTNIGADTVPVKVGLSFEAFALRADCVAVEIGLFKSLVLSIFFNPRTSFVIPYIFPTNLQLGMFKEVSSILLNNLYTLT